MFKFYLYIFLLRNMKKIRITREGESEKILYKSDKTGRTRIWKVHTEGNTIITLHGLKDGKLVKSEKDTIGKNIGRSNETSPEEQAVKEADSLYEKKKKEGYTEADPAVEDVKSEFYDPMLADKYTEKEEKKLKYPVYVQPKLDGVRLLMFQNEEGEWIKQTRNKRVYTFLKHLEPEMNLLAKQLPKGTVFDGELYSDDISFQKITSIARQTTKPHKDEKMISYRIYDMIDPNRMLSFKERFEDLTNAFNTAAKQKTLKLITPLLQQYLAKPLIDIISNFPGELEHVKLVETKLVDDKDEIRAAFSQYIADGYEGLIIRKREGLYESRRSKNLLKYKEFDEDEFEIVGFSEGRGKLTGTVIWRVKNEKGLEFDVTPMGTLEYRTNLYNNATKYIGKMLTVKYQGLTDDGIPRFGIGKDIRDYES
jgi:DNA ligase 1